MNNLRRRRYMVIAINDDIQQDFRTKKEAIKKKDEWDAIELPEGEEKPIFKIEKIYV